MASPTPPRPGYSRHGSSSSSNGGRGIVLQNPFATPPTTNNHTTTSPSIGTANDRRASITNPFFDSFDALQAQHAEAQHQQTQWPMRMSSRQASATSLPLAVALPSQTRPLSPASQQQQQQPMSPLSQPLSPLSKPTTVPLSPPVLPKIHSLSPMLQPLGLKSVGKSQSSGRSRQFVAPSTFSQEQSGSAQKVDQLPDRPLSALNLDTDKRASMDEGRKTNAAAASTPNVVAGASTFASASASSIAAPAPVAVRPELGRRESSGQTMTNGDTASTQQPYTFYREGTPPSAEIEYDADYHKHYGTNAWQSRRSFSNYNNNNTSNAFDDYYRSESKASGGFPSEYVKKTDSGSTSAGPREWGLYHGMSFATLEKQRLSDGMALERAHIGYGSRNGGGGGYGRGGVGLERGYDPRYDRVAPHAPLPERLILGFRRRVFWFFVTAGLLIVLLAVGIGVGVSLGMKSSGSSDDSPDPQTSSTPSATATSSASPTSSAIPPPSSPTSTVDPPTVGCPSANNTIFTVPDNSDISFTRLCGVDYPGDRDAIEDVASVWTATMEDCMINCAGFEGCTACGWGLIRKDPGSDHRCWLKSGVTKGKGVEKKPGWQFAIMEKN